MRNFTMVSPTIWQSRRFKRLSHDAKLLMFYLMTGPHAVSIGCYRLPAGYALTDLGWDMPTYRAAMDELKCHEMIEEDEVFDLIWIDKWEKFMTHTNINHRKASEKIFDRLPVSSVTESARAAVLGPTSTEKKDDAGPAATPKGIPEHLNTAYLAAPRKRQS